MKHISPKAARRILAEIRPHLSELITILEQWEQSDTLQSKADLIASIEAYGIVVSAAWDDFSEEQLAIILNALQIVKNRLGTLWRDCTDGPNRLLTDDEIFRRVFANRGLEFRYNPDIESSSTSLYPVGDSYVHIIDFAESAFNIDTTPERQQYLSENVIIHELGHVFHNELGLVAGFYPETTATTEDEIPVAGDVYQGLTVDIGGLTPQVIVDFWQHTDGYWSTRLDNGCRRTNGCFTINDALDSSKRVVPLTKGIFGYKGTVNANCASCPDNTLVDFEGVCFKDSNGNCIPSEVALDRSQDTSRFVYVRHPEVTYIPNYLDETRDIGVIDRDTEAEYNFENLFHNERREADPSPSEGFADTFVVHTRYPINPLPGDEPRRQFFDEHFCEWLISLIGEG